MRPAPLRPHRRPTRDPNIHNWDGTQGTLLADARWYVPRDEPPPGFVPAVREFALSGASYERCVSPRRTAHFSAPRARLDTVSLAPPPRTMSGCRAATHAAGPGSQITQSRRTNCSAQHSKDQLTHEQDNRGSPQRPRGLAQMLPRRLIGLGNRICLLERVDALGSRH
jgi:hypothetical protein